MSAMEQLLFTFLKKAGVDPVAVVHQYQSLVEQFPRLIDAIKSAEAKQDRILFLLEQQYGDKPKGIEHD